jgi:hypothetical protein
MALDASMLMGKVKPKRKKTTVIDLGKKAPPQKK